MSMINKLKYYGLKAIKNPELIVPFLKQKVRAPFLRIPIYIQKRNLEDQKKLLDELREEDNYLLIILDACRYDALEEVAEDYFTEPNVRSVFGTARNTFEWGKYAWGDEEYFVRYLSGAAPINSIDEIGEEWEMLYEGYIPSDYILNIRDLWDELWTEGEIPPEEMTEVALEENQDRMVVHYYQPHAPFVGELKTEDVLGEELKKDHDLDERMWNRVESGEISDDELWELYISNLRRALDSVKELVEKTDYENVVITADHGEALGEYGVYGHPKHVDHPKVRVVPWLRLK